MKRHAAIWVDLALVELAVDARLLIAGIQLPGAGFFAEELVTRSCVIVRLLVVLPSCRLIDARRAGRGRATQ